MEDLKSLPTGSVYLTLGTVEQISQQIPGCGLLYHPTTQEIRKALEQVNPFDPPAWVIWPKSLKGTGTIKVSGDIRQPEEHGIPTDQFLRVHPQAKVFIPFCSLGATTFYKDEAKKIQGGPYRILDLRIPHGSPQDHYPEAQQYQKSLGIPLGPPESSIAVCMIEQLLERSGVDQWGQMRSSDIYRWFRPPGQQYCPVTSAARAWCLEPWLKPWLDLSEQRYHQEAGLYLKRFGIWVYGSTKWWGVPGAEGLRKYKAKSKGKSSELYTYSFRPSPEARSVWLQWIGAVMNPRFYARYQSRNKGNKTLKEEI